MKTPNLILFLWLIIAVNFFHFGSYMAGWFIAPSFDWIKFIEDFTPLWLWKTILTLTGILFIIMGFHFLTKYWLPLIVTELDMRKKRIAKITTIPWITFTIVSLSGIIFFKTDQKMMMLMGAFGNTAFFLIWMLFLRFRKFNKKETEYSIAIPLEKSYSWIISGFVLLLFYIFIMGPGMHFTK